MSDGFMVKDATGRTYRFEPAPGVETWKVSKSSAVLKTAAGKNLVFAPAPHDIEVVDVWPPGRLTEAAQDAYDALAASGRIIPRGLVTRDAAGRVIVRYMADIPEQWIRQELREAKMNGKQIGIEQVKEVYST